MSGCPVENCYAPDATCALGNLLLKNCPNWGGQEKLSAEPSPQNGDEIVLPWSGSALGKNDVAFITDRKSPLTVGILGAENAGKTSLLAAWYLLIGRGAKISSRHTFSGSFTLSGWEAVARSMQWRPGVQPEFPPHTSTRGTREKGLLHLSFMEDSNLLRDYLFADAPGLWFQRWAINEEAPDAQGARWVVQNADAFILTADCAALAGTERGSARSAIQLLARRLSANLHGRPVALAWTKSDIAIADTMRQAVLDAVSSQIPDFIEISVSMQAPVGQDTGVGVGLTDLLRQLLETRRLKATLPASRAKNDDPLFLFGARS